MTGKNPTFEPRSEALAFSQIGHDLRTVVDLLDGLESAKRSVVVELIAQRDALRASGAPIVLQGIDMTKEVIEEFDLSHIPAAEVGAAAMREGAASLLVFAFFERGLRAICEEVALEAEVKLWIKKYLKGKRGQGKIEGYLSFLRDQAKLEFRISRDIARVISRERELRNTFAHGDWDLHYMISSEGVARGALAMLPALFGDIEEAFIRQAAV